MFTSWTQSVLSLAVLGLAAARLTPASPMALSVDQRTDEILATMSVDHLVGQMAQVDISSVIVNGTLDETKVTELAKFKLGSVFGSPFSSLTADATTGWGASQWRSIVTRIQELTMKENGGHPLLFGVDSVHGAVYIEKATLFGQQINAGASFNPDLVYRMGEITAKDTVAAGVPWIFSPILEISQNKMWSRTYETFGEDPHTVSVLGAALIKGLQAKNDAAACMKHFVGYSKTPTGHDKDPVAMGDFELLNKFIPPFVSAVAAGVKTGMENYISINGEPVVSSTKILRDLLRHDLGFEGFMVTDYFEIFSLVTYHHVAKTPQDAVSVVLKQTSIDMNMNSYGTEFIAHAKAALATDASLLDRIKQSARRIIKAKVELGLYDTPVPGQGYVASVGQSEDRQVALALARESIVLLQNNDSVLPLSTSASVFLTGPSADDVGNLCGGWTFAPGDDTTGNKFFPNGVSVKQGIEAVVAKNASIEFFKGFNVTGAYTADDLAKAKQLAGKAEYTIAVIGEGPFKEKEGDIEDPYLPRGQIEFVKQLASTGTKVILVYVGGRPRLLDGLPSSVHAVINAMLPCEAGGQAIAEIIYGKVNPSGRLPITYPKYPSGVDIQYNHLGSTQCTAGSFFTKECEMQWNFGTGLSYTTFSYSNMTLSKTNVTGEGDSVTASVTVTNSGTRSGKETVMLFLTQPFRALSLPEVKALKAFDKIELAPKESKTVSFTLTHNDWGVYKPQIGKGFLRVAEPGEFVVAFKPETNCDVYNATAVVDLCAKFNLV